MFKKSFCIGVMVMFWSLVVTVSIVFLSNGWDVIVERL